MTSLSLPRPRWLRFTAWPLSAQVIFALALALLPLGALSLIAAYDNYRDFRIDQARLAVARLEAVRQSIDARLDQGFSVLQVLLLDPTPTPQARADCDRQLTQIAQADNRISSLVRLDAAGRLLCASAAGPLSEVALTQLPLSRPLVWGRFARALLVDEATPARDVVLAARDLAPDGSGHVMLARLQRADFAGLLPLGERQTSERIELRRHGETLAEWGPAVQFSTAAAAPQATEFVRVDGSDGQSWVVGAAPLGLPGVELRLARPIAGMTAMQALAIALPALMWLAALLIGWLAIRTLVVDPLLTFRRVVDRYARGDTDARIGDRFPTQEMEELGTAFDRMADTIDAHEREMRDALATQKKLTREVHHRVKNNLQIVASLLSLQSRDATNADVAYAYATIQKRVNALALVHRWLFDDEAMRGVDLRSLAHDLCAGLEQSVAASEGAQITIAPDVERVLVGQDTAVPLAFLITELVTAAARHARGLTLPVRITVRKHSARATLVVEAPSFRGGDRFGTGTEPAARIVLGMARQMRTQLVYDGERGSYAIEFPLVG